MKVTLLIIGALLVLLGVGDFIGANFMRFDIWRELDIDLPDAIWKWSAYIEMGLGGFLFSLGKGNSEESDEEDSEEK